MQQLPAQAHMHAMRVHVVTFVSLERAAPKIVGSSRYLCSYARLRLSLAVKELLQYIHHALQDTAAHACRHLGTL